MNRVYQTARLAMLSAMPVLCASHALATQVSSDADFDRWNYPFNNAPGTRALAPTFGAAGTTPFDDHDGQFLIGFDVSSLLPTPGPGETLQINSVKVSATHSTGQFAYDPTYDSYATLLDNSDPSYLADSDAGRPIFLTGAGFQSSVGYISATTGFDFAGSAAPPFYAEDEVYGFGDPTLPNIRSAYAAAYVGGSLTNISNNVTDGYDFTPFAVGTTSLAPGANVVESVSGISAGSTFEFDINLADTDISSYVDAGISSGELFFSITSLHDTTQQAGGSNPNFFTTENFDPAAIAPSITIDYTLVTIPGDFNSDGNVDELDIDLLFANFGDAAYDLTGDSLADDADVDELVRNILNTEYGDMDLNGTVDVVDLGNFATFFGAAGGWEKGDFTGNSLVDVVDLGILATYFGFDSAAALQALDAGDLDGFIEIASANVPEPTTLAMLSIVAIGLAARGKRS